MSKPSELYVFNQFPWEKGEPDPNKIIFCFTTSVHTYVFIDFSKKEGAKIIGMGWSRGGMGSKIKFKSQKEAWNMFLKYFEIPTRFMIKDFKLRIERSID